MSENSKLSSTAQRYAAQNQNNNTSNNNKDIPQIEREMLFDKDNFIFFGIGLAVVVLGFILMSGGQMPDANTFDESIIYSFRRITLAPAVVLIGLVIIVYGIFRDKKTTKA